MLRAARRFAGDLYRRVAGFAGVRALGPLVSRGLPPELVPALRFLFAHELPDSANRAAERVESLRASLASRSDRFGYIYRDNPLGTVRWPELLSEGEAADELITSRELALRISVPRRWGLVLHLVAEGFRARTILETGACVGISGAYLATVSTSPRFVTVEGSKSLADVTRGTVEQVSDAASVINQPFETGLGAALDLLDRETRPVDLAYIDGHHDEQATLHYVQQVLPHLGKRAVIVLDDIYLYEEMWRAWETIIATFGFASAVNIGRFGLLVWNGSAAPSTTHFDLGRYTGLWRVGTSRQRSVGA